ncbi:Asp-tRNA(Asn)/Glu-tRNA(Gln) amidotransferase A subunit family amidase [Conyzicola lurida]|uniref:Asp-tRNA(Asn)/Glu-tRNA(Gln) amidotransferase A subunit family amidase n=1 Tax=Conyzicola lurida TaxID=1172621 RepID=A0A841ALG3_9MICO|nr:AtzH-like domain-containing protein [Conyzicola lurida]MBB5844067.1 Asp-tRNA(Asn)/Glu-tRNA(Gln) amidotransferase A subunit family amidase [Conyzicola lurida]
MTDVNLGAAASAPDGLLDAFWAYETALMANDLAELDRLFAAGDDTLRGDAGGILYGHDAISTFRKGRGGALKRTIVSVVVREIDEDAAVVVAVTAPVTGGRGQQTQLWRRIDGDWAVEVAHVSLPAPAVNATVWRTVGTPLVAGAEAPELASQTVAVKDLFDVAGFAVGAGVPAYLAEAPLATAHAPAVAALLATGADIAGIARTDEFAYSIAGRNPHYGTPPNGAVVGGIPGGSSSGPASAVALGQASIGLGTDTGGSLRVPASYQGLWGLRTTHGAVSVEGLLPLAPSFDTVGWLTRDAWVMRAAATASLDLSRQVLPPSARFAVAGALTAQSTAGVSSAFEAAIETLAADGLIDDLADVDLGHIDDLFETFRVVQAAEAWATHGEWIVAHPGALGDDIAARFAWASTISAEAEARARVALAAARLSIEDALDGRTLLLPAASSVAPSATASPETIESTRASTLRLTCIAGLTGRPGLSVPALTVDGAPVGLCVVAPRYGDLGAVITGAKFHSALVPQAD